jgi:hypothetical protein
MSTAQARKDLEAKALLDVPERKSLGLGDRDDGLMLVAIPEVFEDSQRIIVSSYGLHRLDDCKKVIGDPSFELRHPAGSLTPSRPRQLGRPRLNEE